MAIVVPHSRPTATQVKAAFQVGLGTLAQKEQEFAEQQRQFDERLDQQDDQFYTNLYAQRLSQQQNLQANLLNNAADNQAALYRDQFQHQAQLERDEQQWMADGGDVLSQQAGEILKGFRTQQLTPEGQRVLSQLNGSYRAIQAQRGRQLRPAAYAEAMGDWMESLQQAGLDQFVVPEVPVDQQFQQEVIQQDDGTYWSKEADGNWRQHPAPKQQEAQELPVKPLTAQEIQASTHTLEDGTRIIFNPRDPKAKPTVVPPAKQTQSTTAAGGTPLVPEEDFNKEYATAEQAILNERQLNQKEILKSEKQADGSTKNVGTGEYEPIKPPTREEVLARMRERDEARKEYYGASSQSPAAPPAAQPAPLGTAPATPATPEPIGTAIEFPPNIEIEEFARQLDDMPTGSRFIVPAGPHQGKVAEILPDGTFKVIE